MAQMWSELEQGAGQRGRWGVVSLEGQAEALALTGNPSRPLARMADPAGPEGAYIIRHDGHSGKARWILYASPAAKVTVNGRPVGLGMRALRDRDEIALSRACHLVFTSDSMPRVELFGGMDHDVDCPRCTLPIKAETPAVRCPNCGVWHHEYHAADVEDADDDRLCWTYGPTCGAGCPQTTALDAGPGWTPEDL